MNDPQPNEVFSLDDWERVSFAARVAYSDSLNPEYLKLAERAEAIIEYWDRHNAQAERDQAADQKYRLEAEG